VNPRAWTDGTWSAAPVATAEEHGALLVTAVEGSDAWRHTAYGFVHDDAHALLAPLEDPGAVEVTFDADYDQQVEGGDGDLDAEVERLKAAGVEFSDGVSEHAWGRIVPFKDPDGNDLQLFSAA